MSDRTTMAPEAVVEVPYARLSPEALRRLVEEFVTRDTTDYGRCEKSLEEKVADVTRQLEHGEAMIVFDAEAQTTHIVVDRRQPAARSREPLASAPDAATRLLLTPESGPAPSGGTPLA